MTDFHSSTEVSSAGTMACEMPALLTSISRRPHRFFTFANSALTDRVAAPRTSQPVLWVGIKALAAIVELDLCLRQG